MSEHETRARFGLYRLCQCPECDGTGKVDTGGELIGIPGKTQMMVPIEKCSGCRGEGRVRQEVASCDTAEAVGVALVTCAREGEWTDADGNPCAFGLLDREGEKSLKWLILPWSAYTPRHVSEAGRILGKRGARKGYDLGIGAELERKRKKGAGSS